MTLFNTQTQQTFQGNGATTVFSYDFPIPVSNGFTLTFIDTDGSQRQLGPTEYTITGIGGSTGGNVTYPLTGPAMSSGQSLVLRRILPLIQPVDIANQGPFYPSVVGLGLDYAVMLIQQLASIAAVSPGWAGSTSNVGNDYVATVPNFTLLDGAAVTFISSASNSGAATLDVSETGAVPIYKQASSGHVAVDGGDIVIGNVYIVNYIASLNAWVVVSPVGTASISVPVQIADGGTGATSAANARTSLGVQKAETISAKSGSFSVLNSDDAVNFYVSASGGAAAASLPALSTVPASGMEVTIKKTDSSANAVNINANGSDTIDGASSLALGSQYATVTIVADKANNTWRIKARAGTVLAAYGITFGASAFDEPIFIAQPTAQTYLVVLNRRFAGTITGMSVKTSTGTCNVQLQQNGSNVGSALGASSTIATSSLSQAFSIGDNWGLVISSISGAANLSVDILYTRQLP